MSVSRTTAALLALAVLSGAPGCASKKKAKQTAEVLTAEQTMARVELAMANHELRKAKTLLGKIQFTPAERSVYEPLVRLGLADATYYLGDDLCSSSAIRISIS
jgi:hypothetical protein